jgi:hypothetical protein
VGRVWTPRKMQAKTYFGTGMWSGADVCPASCGEIHTPRAFMEFVDRIPIGYACFGALIPLLVYPIPFSDRLPIILR